MKKLLTLIIIFLFSANNTYASGFTDINCKFNNGHSIIEGNMIKVEYQEHYTQLIQGGQTHKLIGDGLWKKIQISLHIRTTI